VVELYNAYFDRIYSLIFHQVDRDREAAEDIVQETFLAASKSAVKFRGRSKVYTWLYSIASRKVADFYRRRKREAKYQTVLSDSQSLERDPSSGGGPLVAGIPESEETSRAVQETLSGLPLHYKQVLLLKYVEEMPVAEISQVMGRSPKSIEGLLTRARKELRHRLTTPNEG
jgi:RNA polymerase sigma-70 factor (ECF subfamily)